MNKLKETATSGWIHFQRNWYRLPEKEEKMEKKPGGKEIIVEFVLMVVAVAVGYIFRDQIKTLISSLGTSVSDKISAMFNGS